jgi:hypothetical protein
VRSNPFLDEIAIDFPSTGRFVERACQAFVRDAASPIDEALRAEVSVSREEAYRGAILPIDVALRSTCQYCGGRGETWAEFCVDCDGRGEAITAYLLHIPVPPGVVDGSRFLFRVRPPRAGSVRVEVTVAIRSLSQ